MSTCRRVAHGLTELREGELSFFERLGLRAHMTICPSCRRYVGQVDATIEGLGHCKETLSEDESQALVERLKQRRR